MEAISAFTEGAQVSVSTVALFFMKEKYYVTCTICLFVNSRHKQKENIFTSVWYQIFGHHTFNQKSKIKSERRRGKKRDGQKGELSQPWVSHVSVQESKSESQCDLAPGFCN